jgi:hypothetical protein
MDDLFHLRLKISSFSGDFVPAGRHLPNQVAARSVGVELNANPLSVSVNSTFAEGIRAPEESLTVPETEPVTVITANARDFKASRIPFISVADEQSSKHVEWAIVQRFRSRNANKSSCFQTVFCA